MGVLRKVGRKEEAGGIKTGYRLFPSYRLLIAIVLFLSCFVVNINFYSFNFAITCMVNDSYIGDGSNGNSSNVTTAISDLSFTGGLARDVEVNNSLPGMTGNLSNTSSEGDALSNASPSCHRQTHGLTSFMESGPVLHRLMLKLSNGASYSFHWNRQIQSNLLAAEAIGSIWFILIVSVLLDKYGVKWLYLAAVLLLALMSFVLPLCARGGWGYVFANRALQGIGMEITLPATFYVVVRWFPANELGFITGLVFCGFPVAAIFAMLMSGLFCAHPDSIGWEPIFYLMGAVTVLCAAIWTAFYSDKVVGGVCISAPEVAHIKRNRAQGEAAFEGKTPWFSIVTSLPVLALIIAYFSTFYCFYFIGDFSPTYFKEVLKMSSSESGSMAAIPFLATVVARNLGGIGSDIFVRRRLCSMTTTVKIFTALSGLPSAALFIAITFCDADSKLIAVACVVGAYFFYGLGIGGFMRSACLLAPQFTGTISGLGTTAMYASGILCPFITGWLTPDGTHAQWNLAFYVSSGVIATGTVFFIIFGSGDRQSWAEIVGMAERRKSLSSLGEYEMQVRRISIVSVVGTRIVHEEVALV